MAEGLLGALVGRCCGLGPKGTAVLLLAVALPSCEPWTGVKPVTLSLGEVEVDQSAPISLHLAIPYLHVQWGGQDGKARLTQFILNGSENGTLLSRLGRPLYSGATLLPTGSLPIPLLPVDDEILFPVTGGPVLVHRIEVAHPAGNTDYSVSSHGGALAKVADDVAILAANVELLDGATGESEPNQVFLAKIRPQGNTITYNADELLAADSYWKGTRYPAPGENFAVTAAAPRPGGGLIAAGPVSDRGAATSSAFVYVFDADYELIATTTLAPAPVVAVRSVTTTKGGNILLCGSSDGDGQAGFVAQLSPLLQDSSVLMLEASGSLSMGGCAVSPEDGALIVSGWFTGAHGRVQAQGADMFLARVTVGNGPPTESSFAAFGTAQEETNISAPAIDSQSGGFVAGVTTGDFGDAIAAPDWPRVFVGAFDAATLTLQ